MFYLLWFLVQMNYLLLFCVGACVLCTSETFIAFVGLRMLSKQLLAWHTIGKKKSMCNKCELQKSFIRARSPPRSASNLICFNMAESYELYVHIQFKIMHFLKKIWLKWISRFLTKFFPIHPWHQFQTSLFTI